MFLKEMYDIKLYNGGNGKMRKVIIFGCCLAGFLLLMVPNVNSIEFQNQKNIITSEMETIDYASFMKIVKQVPKDERRVLRQDIIQNLPNILDICQLLLFFCVLFLLISPRIANNILYLASNMECGWAGAPHAYQQNTNTPCSSCALEELTTLIPSHSQN